MAKDRASTAPRRRGPAPVPTAQRAARAYMAAIARGPRRCVPLVPRRAVPVVWSLLVVAPLVLVACVAAAILARSWAYLAAAALAAAVVVLGLLVVAVTARRTGASDRRQRRRRRGRPRARELTLPFGPMERLQAALGRPDLGWVRPRLHDRSPGEPDVSVVVTCHNDALYLGATLYSVQRQSLTTWECIVIDDASTDESMDVALLFAERDSRFQVLRQEENRGLPATRNAGLAVARGRYVMFLDSDDFLYRESLSKRLAAMPTSGTCVGTYCDWRSVPEDAPYAERPVRARLRRQDADVHLLVQGWQVPFIASAPLLRTDVMRATGGFDEDLRTAEDADMWARLLRGGVWIRHVPYVGVAYRQKTMSMVRRSPLGHLAAVDAVARWLDEPVTQVWPGAPVPLTAPLASYLREQSLLERRLKFLAMHFALGGGRDGAEPHLPSIASRSTPAYPEQVVEQTRRALKRLGDAAVLRRDQVLAQVLAVAPPVDPPPARPPGGTTGAGTPGVGCVSLAAPVRLRALSELRSPVFLLVPQSRYHVAEIGPLLQELRRRGLAAEVYLPPEAGAGVSRELSRYVDTVYSGDPEQVSGAPLLGAMVLNDWGQASRTIVDAVRASGGVSFAKVEGVQDFTDADTGRVRSPYQHADVVLGQGRNDVEALPAQNVVVVGSSRLERLRAAPAVSPERSSILINFNFTYRVLTDRQDDWLDAAVDGARACHVDYEISVHPAQKNVPQERRILAHVSPDPFSHALLRSGVLVSRFSTVLYEAMAVGVPVIYLNTHGERVPTFQQPDGAFLKVTSGDLAEPLATALSWRGSYRERSDAFFRRQVDIVPGHPSEQRAADVIMSMLPDGPGHGR